MPKYVQNFGRLEVGVICSCDMAGFLVGAPRPSQPLHHPAPAGVSVGGLAVGHPHRFQPSPFRFGIRSRQPARHRRDTAPDLYNSCAVCLA
jgi:hypothetical protein